MCGNPSPTGRLLNGWGSSSLRAAGVAPRIYAAVPPHLGRISSHLWVRKPSISQHLQLPGYVNVHLPGGYRPARRGNFSPTGWLPIGWGSLSQCAANVKPRGNAAVLRHPWRIRSHLWVINPSISLQLQQPGAVQKTLLGRYRPAGC